MNIDHAVTRFVFMLGTRSCASDAPRQSSVSGRLKPCPGKWNQEVLKRRGRVPGRSKPCPGKSGRVALRRRDPAWAH